MNNPPAFPQPISKVNYDTRPEDFQLTQCGGMTLRDYFAKAAMEGFLAFIGPDTTADFDTIAQMAYDMADAMMEQRAKRP
jgi:hypothetical protein